MKEQTTNSRHNSNAQSGWLRRLVLSDFNVTNHAEKRWTERFKGKCMDNEFRRSRYASEKMIKKIKRWCPSHTKEVEDISIEYRHSASGAIFVVKPPATIVTILDANQRQNVNDSNPDNNES